MTRAAWIYENGILCGFSLSGYCGGTAGRDIVCAAVSSAAYMAANTITEVCGCRAAVTERDGHLEVRVPLAQSARCRDILLGFRLHMEQLAEQYPTHIHLEKTEE